MANLPHRLSSRVLIALFPGAFCLVSGNAGGGQTAGWVERARVEPSGIELQAKLDTGAKTSSLNAVEIEAFLLDGEDHVRFRVQNKAGDSVELVRPVVRQASIRRHFGASQRRPVVRLTICVGDLSRETEVNLVDRAGFDYPLLIGRSYLEGNFLVDPGATFTLEPRCGKEVSD